MPCRSRLCSGHPPASRQPLRVAPLAIGTSATPRARPRCCHRCGNNEIYGWFAAAQVSPQQGPPKEPCTGPSDVPRKHAPSPCSPNSLFSRPPLAAVAAAAASAYLQAWTRQNHPSLNLTYYKRRIMAMPFMAACGWAGLGSVGCGTLCYTWLQVCVRGTHGLGLG